MAEHQHTVSKLSGSKRVSARLDSDPKDGGMLPESAFIDKSRDWVRDTKLPNDGVIVPVRSLEFMCKFFTWDKKPSDLGMRPDS